MGVSFRGSKAYRNNSTICRLVPGKTKVTGYPCNFNAVSTDFDLTIKGNSTQGLPEEYQQVEYIESSGAQYINTGVTATQKTSAYVDFQYLQTESTFIFGSRISTGEAAYTLSSGNSSTNIVSAFGSSWNTIITNLDLNRHTFYKDTFKCTLDDISMDVGSATAVFTCPGPLYLFACYQTTGPYLHSTSRIFEFKLWQNGRLVRDMVPCYRKKDKVAGFYDCIGNKFYTNVGSGNFAVGTDIYPATDKPVEIQSVGERTKNLFNKTTITEGKNLVANTGSLYNSATRSVSDYIPIIANQTYHVDYGLGFQSYKDQGSTPYGVCYNEDLTFYAEIPNKIYTETGFYFTAPVTGFVRLNCYINMEDYMQVEIGNTATEYEPYGYKIPIKIQANNLFDYSLLTNYYNIDNANNIVITNSNTLGWVSMSYLQLKPLTTYTLSAENLVDVDIRTDDLNVKLFRGSTTSAVFTTDETGIAKFKLFSPDAVYPYNLGWIQLEEGNVTQYPKITNVYLKEPLRKFREYTDILDLKEGKVIRNVKHYEFTGDEYWGVSSKSPGCAVVNVEPIYAAQSTKPRLLCDRLISDNTREVGKVDMSFTSGNPSGSQLVLGLGYETKEEVVAYIKEQYNKGTPVYVEYPLYEYEEENILDIPKIECALGNTYVDITNTLQPSNMQCECMQLVAKTL